MNNKEPTDDQLQDSLECCQDGQDAKIIAAAYYREKAGREKTESELKTYIKTSNEKSALISDLRDELKEAMVRAENAENKLKDSVVRMEAALKEANDRAASNLEAYAQQLAETEKAQSKIRGKDIMSDKEREYVGRRDPSCDEKSPAPAPINPETGQHDGHWVLGHDERKGRVRPVRLSYIHDRCGSETRMPQAIAETYAANPHYYTSTFCCACRDYFPVGEHGEFHWSGNDEKVGT